MCMQVHIHADLLVVHLLLDSLSDSPDRWLGILVGIDVVTIQILPKCIQAVITTIDTIRVQHRNNLKYEAFSQDPCLLTLLVSEELPDAIEDEARWCFSWVHPR